MTEKRLCPKCGAELSPGAAQGLCPKCLLDAGLGSRATTAEAHSHAVPPDRAEAATVPPPSRLPTSNLERLARQFPQLDNFEHLGQGGMGVVYKARQRELNRLVAVKILPPSIGDEPAFAERFTREAQALARLNHPNIVQVHDFGRTDECFYFVMEFVDGVNLRALIRDGKLKPEEALKIVPQICEALQFAHDEGIVHRDIKPENILVDKKGRVKIADFGLAKLLGHPSEALSLTGTGQLMGTLGYMAPEQLQEAHAVDHRADIYSLGVVFYEMLTGQLPIGRFALPSKKVQIDVRIDEVVLRALEQEPDQRYQHAGEVKTELEEISSSHDKATLEWKSGPGSAAARPTERSAAFADQPKTIPIGRASGAKIWKVFGLCVLGWLFTAAMWNFRYAGLTIAALVMGAMFTTLAYRRVGNAPRVEQRSHRFPRLAWCINFGFAMFTAVIGFYFLLNTFATCWDVAYWNTAAVSQQQFAKSCKGQEYKLLRQLGAFKEQIPTAELTANGGTSTAGWLIAGNSGPHNGLFSSTSVMANVAMSLLFLFGAVLQVSMPYDIKRNAWPSGSVPKALRCAGALTAAVFLTGLLAFCTLIFLQIAEYSGRLSWLDPGSVTVTRDARRTMEATEKWAQREGFSIGDTAVWSLQSVPKGDMLGEVRLTSWWKPSPFDRWRMTRHGLEQVSPHLVVTCISSQKPVETVVRLSYG